MSIRKKDKLDLELMSYTDIAYEIIKEDKKQYNTPNLFKEVCLLAVILVKVIIYLVGGMLWIIKILKWIIWKS